MALHASGIVAASDFVFWIQCNLDEPEIRPFCRQSTFDYRVSYSRSDVLIFHVRQIRAFPSDFNGATTLFSSVIKLFQSDSRLGELAY